MGEFKLHSYGKDWFHFRKNLDSIMESFSVTFCHDGTICMTGDYGCLSWRREFFSGIADYGVPNKETGIAYFAEKVVRAEEEQKIKDWKSERAIREITDTIHDEEFGWSERDIEALNYVLGELGGFENGEYGYSQMIEAFSNTGIESEYYGDFGRDYTDRFKMKFEMLKSVSELILNVVNKNGGGKYGN